MFWEVLGEYLWVFIISMVPIVELRGAIPVAEAMGLNPFIYFPVAVVGNMLPVPIIFLFARRVLEWGADKKIIGKPFTWILEKGDKAGKKLMKNGPAGLFVGLMLFVGIPLPGTGAWTGTLGASLLNMKFKDASLSVMLGVLIAGVIMSAASILAHYGINLLL
ncbi:MAG: small multi-drug export protein [Clostridia bacterium]|nr:small multi-drug export protein [Clostridia bacterium]